MTPHKKAQVHFHYRDVNYFSGVNLDAGAGQKLWHEFGT